MGDKLHVCDMDWRNRPEWYVELLYSVYTKADLLSTMMQGAGTLIVLFCRGSIWATICSVEKMTGCRQG